MKLILIAMLALSLGLTAMAANQASAWTQKDCDDWFRTHGTVHPDCKGKPTPTPSAHPTPTPTHTATPTPTATGTPVPTPTTLIPPSRPTYTPGPVCQEAPPITVPCSPMVTPIPHLPNTSTSDDRLLLVIVFVVIMLGLATRRA